MANRYWLRSEITLTTEVILSSAGGLSTSYTFTTGCDISVEGDTNELTWNPHPTEFYPYAEVKTQGTGDLTALGYVNFKWTSGDGYLTMEQWRYLMNFFTRSQPSVDI